MHSALKRKTRPGSTYPREYMIVKFAIFETRPFFMFCGSSSFCRGKTKNVFLNCNKSLKTNKSAAKFSGKRE